MKKVSFLLLLIVLCAVGAFAQGIPQGMKYQAVARNLVGGVIPNQEISLKISLLTEGSGGAVYYTEVHTVTTNQLGLFTLVVGEGKVEKGAFKAIPWSTEDVWMQVALKDKGKSEFATISNSKLFAVPYAFHAATAGKLVSNSSGAIVGNVLSATNTPVTSAAAGGGGSGITPTQGNSWNTGGNLGTTPPEHYLGTADNVFFVIKTNNIERLRISADGNIDIRRSLSIGANLNVDSSVSLNRTTGSTLNNGPFTVGTLAKRSPTFLFGPLTVDSAQPTKLGGTLTVDKATLLNTSLTVFGPTDLNSRLNVNQKSPTTLTGSLQVKGITNLDSALNVNGKNPTVLTGRLRVDSNAVFNSPTNSDTSLASPNGALAIYGGVGIAKNLTVGGDVRIGGKTTFAGPLRITDATESVNDSTGAITVKGGAGIHSNLNVGGNTTIAGSATVAGVTTINNVLNVNAGAGQVSITGASGGGGDYSAGAYPLVVSGKDQGVMVKITGTTQASSANNFVTFMDGTGVRGRIEGQTQDDLENEEQYKHDVLILEIAVATAVAQEVMAGATLIGALTAAAPCVGVGICVVTPPVSPTVAAAANLVVATARLAATIYGLENYKSRRSEKIGVTYASNGADYAEWLPKLNKADQLRAGEVVGVKNGFISRSTVDAEKIMVISTNPIVLGNMANAAGAEKVAFMGQVPVKVFGKVDIGDYIITTGDNNGFGVAKHPTDLTASDYQQIVGIAWSASSNSGASLINVAVGLANADANKLMQKQEDKIAFLSTELNELKAQVSKTNELLARIISGKNTVALSELPASSKANTTASVERNIEVKSPVAATSSNDDNRWIYNPITSSQIEEGIKLAEQMMADKGISAGEVTFFKNLKTDANYKATFMTKFKENYDRNVARIKIADKIAGSK